MYDLQKTIGSRIKEFRHKRNLTQAELADKANLHVTFIAHIERGKKVCSIKSLQKIAFALNVSVDSLLRMADAPTSIKYDSQTEKILTLVKDKTDKEKKLLYSVADSIFKNSNKPKKEKQTKK